MLGLRSMEERFADGLMLRAFSAVPGTADATIREMKAILATEQIVTVFDRRNGEFVDEVLLASGAEIPLRMPLLDSHNRETIKNVLGSIIAPTVSDDPELGSVVRVSLSFADDGDGASSRAFALVSQGHIQDLSVGYRVLEAFEIPAGQSDTIDGRTYKAGNRTLRIALRWSAHEGSLVAIGADSAAKIGRGETPADDDGARIETNDEPERVLAWDFRWGVTRWMDPAEFDETRSDQETGEPHNDAGERVLAWDLRSGTLDFVHRSEMDEDVHRQVESRRELYQGPLYVFLTFAEVAKRLECDEATVQRLIDDGDLQEAAAGNLVTLQALNDYLENGT